MTGRRRFKHEAWNEELVFDYIKQSYLLTSRWVHSVVGDVERLDPKDIERSPTRNTVNGGLACQRARKDSTRILRHSDPALQRSPGTKADPL